MASIDNTNTDTNTNTNTNNNTNNNTDTDTNTNTNTDTHNNLQEYLEVETSNQVDTFQKNDLFFKVYQTLESLVQGTEYNESNWILLLTKVMTLVNEVNDLTKEDKIVLTAELVFLYLEENSALKPVIYKEIKLTIYGLIETMISKNSTNKKQHKANKKGRLNKLMKRDTDVVVSPLQITNILVSRIVTTIKDKKLKVSHLKTEFPSFILLSITLLDKYKHLTGNEKKNLIIQALSKVVSEHIINGKLISFTEEEKTSLDFLLSELPVLIDTLVGVANGKVDFKFNFDNPQSLVECFTKVFVVVKPLVSLCKK